MSMTQDERKFKYGVLQHLKETGFSTFAKYLSLFHFNFATSAQMKQPFVAAMLPGKGIIYINPTTSPDAASMLLRHEAGHEIFKHDKHMFDKLKKLGIDTPSELAYELTNIAGDYHISNKLYDEEDRKMAKKIWVGDLNQEVPGLVTILDFPKNSEYWTMDFDELWEIFVKDYDLKQLDAKTYDPNKKKKLSKEFIEGWNKIMKAYKNGELSDKDLNEILSKLENQGGSI